MQNTRFSRLKQVARASRQNTERFTRQRGVFVTGRSTRQGVASWAVKFSVYPSRLDLLLVNKSPKPTCELTAVTCDLDNPRQSRQNRATLFLKIFNFVFFFFLVKTKYFPKTPKTLKKLFVFESTKIEHVKTHFIKYNHTNEYDIHWT